MFLQIFYGTPQKQTRKGKLMLTRLKATIQLLQVAQKVHVRVNKLLKASRVLMARTMQGLCGQGQARKVSNIPKMRANIPAEIAEKLAVMAEMMTTMTSLMRMTKNSVVPLPPWTSWSRIVMKNAP